MAGGPRAASWSRPETVEAFTKGLPNAVLVRYVEGERSTGNVRRVLDIGCGAARNAVPLAKAGLEVVGLDNATPMITAAHERWQAAGGGTALRLVCARMDALPLATGSCDLVVAHVNLGILFEVMGRPEKALTEYLKALSAEGAAPELYTYLGQVYALRGYADMAEETIRKTTLVDPGLPLAWHALATRLEPLDRPKAAASWRQFLDAVRRDRNRSFWVPIAERRIAALGP
jgi:SAM-dependent methyltransferase